MKGKPYLPQEKAMERILCVDDDLSILRLYYNELSEAGYEVILAKDGREAILKFDKLKPDVVVMDIRMPVMNGIEALTGILGKDRQASVILNSAYPQYRENFMTWGAEAYLVKSSDLNELKQKVREILDKAPSCQWSQKIASDTLTYADYDGRAS